MPDAVEILGRNVAFIHSLTVYACTVRLPTSHVCQQTLLTRRGGVAAAGVVQNPIILYSDVLEMACFAVVLCC